VRPGRLGERIGGARKGKKKVPDKRGKIKKKKPRDIIPGGNGGEPH